MSEWLATVLSAFLCLALGIPFGMLIEGYRTRLKHEGNPDQDERDRLAFLHRHALEQTTPNRRYLIRVSDWGPDFDGQDGTLHRFRWAVLDADAELHAFLGGDTDEVGLTLPYMLGNAPTQQAAYWSALAWVEARSYPHVVVEGLPAEEQV